MGDGLSLMILGKLRPKVTKRFPQGSTESGETAANVLISLLCVNMYVCVHVCVRCSCTCVRVHACWRPEASPRDPLVSTTPVL